MLPFQLDNDLALELLAPRHAQELFELVDANREHLRPWMPWVESTRGIEDTSTFIKATLKQLASNNGFQTAIRAGDRIAGVVGMHGINWANRSTSIGYWLAESAQGQGIMTKACRAYVAHAFGALGLHRVEIRCAVRNARSRAIPKRLGFREEGEIRETEWVHGGFVNHVVYGLLAPEWTAGAGPVVPDET